MQAHICLCDLQWALAGIVRPRRLQMCDAMRIFQREAVRLSDPRVRHILQDTSKSSATALRQLPRLPPPPPAGSSPGMPPPLLPDGSCSPETSASDNAQPSASSPAPGASSGGAVAADVAAEVRSLQQQLERERAARQRLEREKAMLEQRLRGLTHLMLDDSKTLSSPQGGRAAAAVAGVQAPGAARGSPPGVQPPRPRERTSAVSGSGRCGSGRCVESVEVWGLRPRAGGSFHCVNH